MGALTRGKLRTRFFDCQADYATSKNYSFPWERSYVCIGIGQLIAPNNNPDGSDNPTGREKNRRVEVIIKT